jgi:CRISPR system Cascade subunit CasB
MRGAFIEYLEGLYEDEERGALAALRRGLGQDPGEAAAMFPHVVPFLRDVRSGSWSEKAYFLVGALFAMHPGSGERKTSLGNALGEIWHETERDSVEKRFVALLDAHPDDLGEHLRQAISLLRANNVQLDWEMLLEHVEHWTHEDRWAQRRWAHDFWTSRKKESAPVEGVAQEGAPS